MLMFFWQGALVVHVGAAVTVGEGGGGGGVGVIVVSVVGGVVAGSDN